MIRPQLVAVGTSLGGLSALIELLKHLPATMPVPLVVVQHRSAATDSGLAELLQDHTALTV